MGDRWGDSMGGTVEDSQYVWLPLAFPTDDTMSMEYFPQIGIDTAAGTVTGLGTWETMSAVHSGKCADAADRSTADGTALIQWSCDANAVNQQFWFKDVGNGSVRIMLRHSGKCLGVRDASKDDGAAVVQYACDEAAAAQQWTVTGTGTTVQLAARHSGKCLDVTGQSTADGTPLVQWTCNAGDNQSWTLRGIGR